MGDQTKTTMRRDVRMLMNPYKKDPGTTDTVTRGGLIEMVLSRQQNDIKQIQMALCDTETGKNNEITNEAFVGDDDIQSNDSETSGFGSSESPASESTASESSQ